MCGCYHFEVQRPAFHKRCILLIQVNDKKVSAMHTGPLENSHVANYRMALTNFPLHLSRKKWTEAERENLRKGIRQQFQEMVLQFSVDEFRYFQCLSYICTY